MKRFFILCAAMFPSCILFAQSVPEQLLSKGVDAFNGEKVDSAIYYWKQITQNYKDSTFYYGRALNNIPVAYETMGNLEKAREAYLAIIHSDLNDREEQDNIMEPYTNYRHNAAMRMARMLAGAKQYTEALQWLQWAETKYPYHTYSGTSFEKRRVSIATWRSVFYEGLNKMDSAVYVVVHKILDTDVSVAMPHMQSFSTVDFYGQVTEEILPIIEKQYTREGFKKALDKVINDLRFTKEGNLVYAHLTLYGLTYRLPSDDMGYTREDFIKRIKASPLYQNLYGGK